MFLSNVLCETVDLFLYDFDYALCADLAYRSDQLDFGVDTVEFYVVTSHIPRNDQTPELLSKLHSSLRPLDGEATAWLLRRDISPDSAYSLDFNALSEQERLDLFLYPSDYLVSKFGRRQVTGPVYCDFRNGRLVGVCVRNISTDLDWVAAAKYTSSNFGFFLFGFDDYSSSDVVYIVEGVFDALVLRKFGLAAIAVASAFPSAFQLACLVKKFGNNLRVCLDNDFHGWCGSFMVSSLLGCQSYQTHLKDPGCYSAQENIDISPISLEALWDRIVNGREEYNDLLKRDQLVRKLPYN